MANKDSGDDKQDHTAERRDSDELDLGRIDPLAGGNSEADDARMVARILGDPPPPPPRIAGRWVLLERLGSGGMGEVHAAYDLTLDCKVAIKFLHLRDGQDAAAARKRLEREAQAMALIRKHANVVQVYNAGTEGERVYLVMEHIDGTTLDEWQEQERTVDEIIAAYLQAGAGLSAIHIAGLVHRDFKPTNALVTVGEAGSIHVAVSDLGLAFATEPGAERPEGVDTESALHPARPLTVAGTQLGTVQYMAPEQLRGEQADARSDQFAFCVSLYEALCGQRPFHESRNVPAALLAAMRRGLPAVKQKNGKPLPARIERTLRRGLSMDPEARFPDMRSLLSELAPRPRRVWPWVTAGLSLPALVLALLFLFRDPSCDLVAGAELAEFLDLAAVEARLVGRRQGVGATTLTGAWDTLGRTLADRAGSWRQARASLCEGQRNSLPDQQLAARQECIRSNRRVLEHVYQAWFAQAGTMAAHPEERLFDAARDLLWLRDCTAANVEMIASPRNEDPVPEPARQARLESFGARLAHIETLDHEANYESAKKLAQDLVNEINGIGNSPILAEVEYRLGHLLTYLDEHDEADRLLGHAADLAAMYDMKALAVDIWLYRLKHALVELDDTELARRWIEVTRYTLRQTRDFGGVNVRQAEYEEALGLLAAREGKPEEAMQHHRRALEIRDALFGRSSTDFAEVFDFLRSKSLNNLANDLRRKNRLDEAATLYQEALVVRERVLGIAHPMVGQVLFNLGLIATLRGDYVLAIKDLARALEIAEKSPAPQMDTLLSRRRALGTAELGAHELEQDAGHLENAREHLDRAARQAGEIAVLHRRLAEEKPAAMQKRDRIDEHVLLAQVHSLLQDFPSALAALEAALRIREQAQDARTCGARQNEYRDDLVSAAYLLCELDRAAEARAYLEKALNPAVSCPKDYTVEIRQRIQDEIQRPTCRP